MDYNLCFTGAAKRQFNKLPWSAKRRLGDVLLRLIKSNHPVGTSKLAGDDHLYRFRDSEHRVIYQITENQVWILVVKAGHRHEVNRNR